jgi:broad specificity phosphatase PhoE
MTLLAVRHGRACFGGADYDQLSADGHEQSRRLGAWLAAHDMRFDAVVCGGMRRHRETLQALVDAYAARGIALPAAETDPDLDEFDHRAVIAAFTLAEPKHPAVLATDGGRRGSPREVFALLHAALLRWAGGELGASCESWQTFRQRTQRAFARVSRAADGGEVLMVSSGGVISQLAQRALDAADARAIELNLSLRNSALCEFHALGDGLRMGSWNGLPHLADARALWTYF